MTTNDTEARGVREDAERGVHRCHVTGNPVGTDTHMVGGGCKCPACDRDRAERDTLEADLVRLAEKEPHFDLRHDEEGWRLYLYRIDLLVGYDWFDTPTGAVNVALKEIKE